MSEKNIAQTLAAAVANLPPEKKQYFIGFAEGVAAMAEPKEKGDRHDS